MTLQQTTLRSISYNKTKLIFTVVQYSKTSLYDVEVESWQLDVCRVGLKHFTAPPSRFLSLRKLVGPEICSFEDILDREEWEWSHECPGRKPLHQKRWRTVSHLRWRKSQDCFTYPPGRPQFTPSNGGRTGCKCVTITPPHISPSLVHMLSLFRSCGRWNQPGLIWLECSLLTSLPWNLYHSFQEKSSTWAVNKLR